MELFGARSRAERLAIEGLLMRVARQEGSRAEQSQGIPTTKTPRHQAGNNSKPETRNCRGILTTKTTGHQEYRGVHLSLNVVIVGDREIRALNRRFLKLDRATDVLAFPGKGALLGEICVSRDRARSQAREHDVPLRRELLLLVLHGFLHLLGYGHRDMPPRYRRYLGCSR